MKAQDNIDDSDIQIQYAEVVCVNLGNNYKIILSVVFLYFRTST